MPRSAPATAAKRVASSVAKSVAKSDAKSDAAKGAAKDAEDGVKKPWFSLGWKRLYLPDFSLALLRPKEGQPPNLATFKVPLRFNKFDFRDYLWNCYGIEVNGVRSFINQMRARQRSFVGSQSGQWYRPRSVKMMIADLKQPFVWPDPPKDLKPWDNKIYMAVEKGQDKQNKEAERRSKYGPQRVRSRGEAGPSRAELARAARLLAYGLEKWKAQAETAKRIGTPQFVRDAKKPGDEK